MARDQAQLISREEGNQSWHQATVPIRNLRNHTEYSLSSSSPERRRYMQGCGRTAARTEDMPTLYETRLGS